MSTAAHQDHAAAAAAVSASDRARLGRRAQLLAAASVTYNAVEGVIALTAGAVAGSVALVGFGLDSAIEVSSGLVILWQFRHRLPESREQQALRLIALSFLALAAYVSVESVRALATGARPDASRVGIGLAVASLLIMPFLAWAQRRTGRALHSGAVVADSHQTLLCTYMSAALLLGLGLNALAGWWWADPVAGLAIAALAAREGRQAWRGEGCCAPSSRSGGGSSGTAGTAGTSCGPGASCGPGTVHAGAAERGSAAGAAAGGTGPAPLIAQVPAPPDVRLPTVAPQGACGCASACEPAGEPGR